jgi:hypothetical protein
VLLAHDLEEPRHRRAAEHAREHERRGETRVVGRQRRAPGHRQLALRDRVPLDEARRARGRAADRRGGRHGRHATRTALPQQVPRDERLRLRRVHVAGEEDLDGRGREQAAVERAQRDGRRRRQVLEPALDVERVRLAATRRLEAAPQRVPALVVAQGGERAVEVARLGRHDVGGERVALDAGLREHLAQEGEALGERGPAAREPGRRPVERGRQGLPVAEFLDADGEARAVEVRQPVRQRLARRVLRRGRLEDRPQERGRRGLRPEVAVERHPADRGGEPVRGRT